MTLNISENVQQDPRWPEFKYLEKVLADLQHFPQHWIVPYDQPIKIAPLTLPTRQDRVELPTPFHIYHTRQRFVQLLSQIMPIINIKQFAAIEVMKLTTRIATRYDLEIHFTYNQQKWLVTFCFDKHYVLKDFSRDYHYKVIPIIPTLPAGTYASSRRHVTYKPHALVVAAQPPVISDPKSLPEVISTTPRRTVIYRRHLTT